MCLPGTAARVWGSDQNQDPTLLTLAGFHPLHDAIFIGQDHTFTCTNTEPWASSSLPPPPPPSLPFPHGHEEDEGQSSLTRREAE